MVSVDVARGWGANAIWVDARPEEDFEKDHVPGATLLNEDRWNELVPPLFHGPVIGYWQAFALLVLCRILFGGLRGWRGSHGHWRRHMWRERWESLTPEERARLRERFMERCGRGMGTPQAGEERTQS